VVSSGPDLARVRADARQLRQAILALVENAIRFSPAGGTIEVVALQNDDRIDIGVRDEGLGVAGEQQNEIFELLRKGENHGGLGVGLFLVRRVAAHFHGEVKFETEEGRGSTFTLSLPAIPGDDALVLTPTPQVGSRDVTP
jgi:two-component system sensor histidine kinase SenX3